jgi:ribosomal protein S27AE
MSKAFAIFIVGWILLGIGSWLFYTKAPYQTKKSAHPFLMVAVGLSFFGFAEWVMRGNVPWFFAVALVVIMFLNIRNTRFCPRCNATLYGSGGGFSRPKFCSKCGAELV